MFTRLKRLLGKRTFTLMIVPDSGEGIRSIRFGLSRLRWGIMAGIAVPITLLAGAFVPGFPGIGDPQAARQNALLRERIRVLDGDLDRLQRRVAEISALESRARLLAGLSPIDPEVRQMGVGGPEFATHDGLAQANPEAAKEVNKVARSGEELLRQAQYQRYSFLEIVESLQKQRESWAKVPSIAPVSSGKLSSCFGERLDPFTEQHSFHRGVDLSAERGTAIFATADGLVEFAGRDGGYGLTVCIDHGNGLETRYAHVLDVMVRRGQRVRRGDEIARVGSSGRSTGSHVHYEVRLNGKAVNPQAYILPADEVVD